MSWTANAQLNKASNQSYGSTFATDHGAELLALIGVLTFALAKRKLTPAGITTALVIAFIHMLDPIRVIFWLPILFFFLGVIVTKIGHQAKAKLTKSSTGSVTGDGTRGAVQVFANSGFAAILVAGHAYLSTSTPFMSYNLAITPGPHLPVLQRVLPIGIVAHYAAVTADTFGSELGILSKSQPFLITAPFRRVAKGTNGGVTIEGVLFGALASAVVTFVSAAGIYALDAGQAMKPAAALLIFAMGIAGTLIDSILGSILQATVVEREGGKVIEGAGGQRVKVIEGGSRVKIGNDILTNNGVNLAMAILTSLLAMALANLLNIQIA